MCVYFLFPFLKRIYVGHSTLDFSYRWEGVNIFWGNHLSQNMDMLEYIFKQVIGVT